MYNSDEIKSRSKQGFTLVELLVVISIIALLLSILMPSLAKVREQAKKVVCGSNQKQLGLAFSMYCNDWGRYPLLYNDIAPGPNYNNISTWPYHTWFWVFDTQGYVAKTKFSGTKVNVNKAFSCPSFPRDSGMWRGWSLLGHPGYSSPHYGVNYTHILSLQPSGLSAKVSSIKRPSEVLLLADSLFYQTGTNYSGGYLIENWQHPWGVHGTTHARHNTSRNGDRGTVNILWADGHVEGVKIEGDIINPRSYDEELGDPYDSRNYGYWDIK